MFSRKLLKFDYGHTATSGVHYQRYNPKHQAKILELYQKTHDEEIKKYLITDQGMLISEMADAVAKGNENMIDTLKEVAAIGVGKAIEAYNPEDCKVFFNKPETRKLFGRTTPRIVKVLRHYLDIPEPAGKIKFVPGNPFESEYFKSFIQKEFDTFFQNKSKYMNDNKINLKFGDNNFRGELLDEYLKTRNKDAKEVLLKSSTSDLKNTCRRLHEYYGVTTSDEELIKVGLQGVNEAIDNYKGDFSPYHDVLNYFTNAGFHAMCNHEVKAGRMDKKFSNQTKLTNEDSSFTR